MKHNRTRVLRWSMDRARWVRSIRTWRNLLPDWTPSLDEQVALESMPHEHRAAVAVVTEGWEANDPRWDVLMALLEWERREAKDQARREHWVKPGAFERLMDAVREEQADSEASACPSGGCTWPDCGCPEIEQPPVREAVIIPVTVVQNGHVITEAETTVETPIKAFFLDNVVPIRHLSEKSHAGSHLPSPLDDDPSRA